MAAFTARPGWGGSNSGGTIFRITTDGNSFQVIRHMTPASDGGDLIAGLRLGSDGRLYGAASAGGANGGGTIFAINTDGTGFVVLKAFSTTSPNDGLNPQSASWRDSTAASTAPASTGAAPVPAPSSLLPRTVPISVSSTPSTEPPRPTPSTICWKLRQGRFSGPRSEEPVSIAMSSFGSNWRLPARS